MAATARGFAVVENGCSCGARRLIATGNSSDITPYGDAGVASRPTYDPAGKRFTKRPNESSEGEALRNVAVDEFQIVSGTATPAMSRYVPVAKSLPAKSTVSSRFTLQLAREKSVNSIGRG